jgi:hypothetical protein
MIHLQTDPDGIDKRIQQVQQFLYDSLGWANHESFGRVYINETRDGDTRPEYFGGRDYREVLNDDRYNAISFFYVQSVRPVGGQMQASISWVVSCYPNKLKTRAHRADEAVREDVLRILRLDVFETRINEVFIGVPAAFADFGYPEGKFFDIHPRHCFRVSLTINYKESCLIQ